MTLKFQPLNFPNHDTSGCPSFAVYSNYQLTSCFHRLVNVALFSISIFGNFPNLLIEFRATNQVALLADWFGHFNPQIV